MLATPEVGTFVREHGGALYVWRDTKACCGGAMTLLRTAAEDPSARCFARIEADGFELWFDHGNLAPPQELHLEVRGRHRRRVEAYWDGCVFAV